jgi:lipopolysaccharide/colanic/teichoic acid biosynthesis glycosyltransferase
MEQLVDDGLAADLRQWHEAERLETLAYADHDGVVIDLTESTRFGSGAVGYDDRPARRSQPLSVPHERTRVAGEVPDVRLDELVRTQALSPTAFGLPDDAFRPAKSRSPLEEGLVRGFDILVALVTLLVASPVMLVVALVVLVDSGGPVFYGSSRVGHRKPSFKAWKFRSMRPDADDQLARVLASDPEARTEYETYHKLHRDPRLTRVGGFLRRSSLDELPQLWNVLKGDMSIVGPRPKLPVDAACYGPALDTVLSVRPGLTGLWQVSGRNDVTMRERVVLDLRYVHNRSLRGDLWICVRTAVILCQPRRHGAY